LILIFSIVSNCLSADTLIEPTIDADKADFQTAYNQAITDLETIAALNSEPNPANLAEAIVVMQKNRQAVISIAEFLIKESKVFKKMVK